MVLVCKYCGKKGGVEGRTLHKFPLQDTNLKSWLQRLNLGPSFVPTNSSRLCSDHFSAECFDKKDTRVMLLPGSIPSIFGEYKITCAYCHSTKEDKFASFRKFPLKNPELVKQWIEAAKLENYVPDNKSVLCSDHFAENCFYTISNTAYLRLKPNAVPSVFKALKGVQLLSKSGKRPSVELLPAMKSLRLSSEVTSPVYVAGEGTRLQDSERVSFKMEESLETSVLPQDLSNENRSVEKDSDMEVPLANQVTRTTSISQTPTARKRTNTPRTPNTAKCKKVLEHDHSYETSPMSLKRKLFNTRKKLKVLQTESKVQKQHIGRLQRKIRTLKDVVSELRRTRAIPE